MKSKAISTSSPSAHLNEKKIFDHYPKKQSKSQKNIEKVQKKAISTESAPSSTILTPKKSIREITKEDQQLSWVQRISSPFKMIKDQGLKVRDKGISEVIRRVLTQKFAHEKLISQASTKILENSNDPMFINFIHYLKKIAFQKVDEFLPAGKDPISQTLRECAKPIKNIIYVNLMNGFANLCKEVSKHKDDIQNYDQQTFFTNLILFVCQSTKPYINQKALNKIEENYRIQRTEFQNFLKRCYPNDAERLQKGKEIEKYIKCDSNDRTLLIDNLLENFQLNFEQIETLASHIKSSQDHYRQLHLIFKSGVEAILTRLFPLEAKSLILPGGANQIVQLPWLSDHLYNKYFVLPMVNFLMDLYQPIEFDKNRFDKEKEILAACVGHETDQIIQAPSSIISGFIVNQIQTNPGSVDFIATILQSVIDNDNAESLQPRQQILNQLSKEQLAGWLIPTLKNVLDSQDVTFIAFGDFLKNYINNFSLSLLAKAKLALLPEDSVIPQDQFIQTLLEKIYASYKQNFVTGDLQLDMKFLEKICEDLQLPEMIKAAVLPELTKSLQNLLLQLNPHQFVEEFLSIPETDAIIKNYKNGSSILSLIDTFTEEIIEKILKKNLDFFGKKEVDDFLNELAEIYLPGISIDKNLIIWIKANISALSNKDGNNSLQTIQLLKQSIQVILKRSIVETIQSNFKDEKEYAAQLLDNFDQAFEVAFETFDETTKKDILQGQTVIKEINDLNEELNSLVKQIKNSDLSILENEKQQLLKSLKSSHSSYTRIKKSNQELQIRREILSHELPAFSEENTRYLAQQLLSKYFQINELRKLPKKIENESSENVQIIHLLSHLKDEELEILRELLNIDITLSNALVVEEQMAIKLNQDYIDCNHAEGDHSWIFLKEETFSQIKLLDKKNELTIRIAGLEKKLEIYLPIFKKLSFELAKLVGLDQEEKLHLPPFLKERAWQHIQIVKEEIISRILFTHFTPLILVINDIKSNQNQLKELIPIGHELMIEICQAISKQAIKQISDFVTNLNPFAQQILTTFNHADLSDEETMRFESTIQTELIQLGKNFITRTQLEEALQDHFASDLTGKQLSKFVDCVQDFISSDQHSEFTPQKVLVLLLQVKKAKTSQAMNKLNRKARILSLQLNFLLFSQGKAKLKSAKLVEIYQKFSRTEWTEETFQEKASLLTRLQITQKIKNIIISPEEIANYLDDFIPGAGDLHALVAPELQAVISGKNATLVRHRELLSQYVEGMLLRVFVKLGLANQEPGKDVMLVFTEKLKNVLTQEKFEGNSEEVSRKIIDHLLETLIGIRNQADFKGVPLPLQNLVYKKMKDACYQYFVPMILPMLEIENVKQELNTLSGSETLEQLGSALVSYVFTILPKKINSLDAIAIRIYEVLEPTRLITTQDISRLTSEIEKLNVNFSLQKNLNALLKDSSLTERIMELVPHSFLDENLLKKLNKLIGDKELANKVFELILKTPKKLLTSKLLITAYLQTKKEKFDRETVKKYSALLQQATAAQVSIVEEMDNILTTPNEIVSLIKNAALPHMSRNLKRLLSDAIHYVTHDKPELMQNTTEFFRTFLEGFIFKLFINIAKKNPPTADKDTFSIAIEKTLNLVFEAVQVARHRPFAEVVKEYEEKILKDVLGLDSPASFEGMPAILQEKVYDFIKNLISDRLLLLKEGIEKIDHPISSTFATQKDKQTAEIQANLQTLTEDLGHFITANFLDFLPHINSDKNINSILRGLRSLAEPLGKINAAVSSILINFIEGKTLKNTLKHSLKNLASAQQTKEDRLKTAKFLSQLISFPLEHLVENAITYEKSLKEKALKFNQDTIKNVLKAVVNFLNIKNQAKANAVKQGRSQIIYSDYYANPSNTLPEGLPLRAESYSYSIHTIHLLLKTKGLLTEKQKSSFDTELAKEFQKLIDQDQSGITEINLDKIVNTIGRCYTLVTAKNLSVEQTRRLRKKNKIGITIESVILKEARLLADKMEHALFQPCAEIILKFFPNKHNDLFFLPVQEREIAWNLIEKNLPTLFPILMEALFNPEELEKLLLTLLVNAKDSLDEKIVLSNHTNKPKTELDEIDEIAGEMIVALMQNVKLPKVLKNLVVDSQGASQSVKQALGSVLREKFNGKFLETFTPVILQALVERDKKTGEYPLSLTPKKTISSVQKAKDKKEIQASLKKASRQLVNSIVSNTIRTRWALFQKRLNKLITLISERTGYKIKQFLDKVFHFIFLTIIGKIISVLTWPLIKLMQELTYRILSIDNNRENILNLFKEVAKDQPLTQAYSIPNAVLFYEVLQKAYEVFEETEKKRKV